MTVFEASKARSTTGAKSVLNPNPRQDSPITFPCLRKSLRLPVAKTSAAEGAGPVTPRNRSTRPPSMSTHLNRGVETQAWQSSSSLKVCPPLTMLRAKRMTPAGCSRVKQGREARRHFRAVEADDQELAGRGQISFLSSASRFSASSGVRQFKSTARNFSSTGCDRGVKMVSCAAGGVAPGERCPVS